MTSSSSEEAPDWAEPVDLAVLKSWDFGDWRERFGHGTELPYRMDYLERHGFRLHWTDSLHRDQFQQSRGGRFLRNAESRAVPFAQTLLMYGTIRRSPVTLAMFESEANFLAVARQARIASRRSVFVVLTCWLAHILTTCSPRQLAAYRWAYRSVDRLYYLSANQGPILEEYLRLPPDRLRYVPFGVDTVGFSPTEEPDADYILAVGRDRGRDWPTLLQAVDGLALPVKVCCRPADLAGLRIPDNVEVLGYVDRERYRRLLSRARVVAITAKPVVYPSGQSVMLEAMAMARTVVVTGTEAMGGYVEDGLNSLVVPPADSSVLREAIRSAVNDDNLRQRLGLRARRSAVGRFDAETMWATIASDITGLTDRTKSELQELMARILETPSQLRSYRTQTVAPHAHTQLRYLTEFGDLLLFSFGGFLMAPQNPDLSAPVGQAARFQHGSSSMNGAVSGPGKTQSGVSYDGADRSHQLPQKGTGFPPLERENKVVRCPVCSRSRIY